MKLNYRRTFTIGLAFLSISAFWQVYDNLIPLILKKTFGIGDFISGWIMAADNVLALFMLPLFGALSDRIRTPMGKRMPFIVGGTALTVISMIFLPISDNTVRLPMFIVALFFTLIFMSTYRSPAVALMPDITPKPLRSKANAVINLMGAIGGAVSLSLIFFIIPKTGKPDYFPIFAVVAGLMVVAVVILVLSIKENRLVAEMDAVNGHEKNDEERETGETNRMPDDVKRSLVFILLSIFLWFMAYNAVTTAFSKYAQDFLGVAGGGFAMIQFVATVAAIVAFIPVGFLATRIGRRKTILSGVVLMFVSFVGAYLFTSYHPLLNILLVFIGASWAAINVNSYPMVVEMAKGSDVGKYTGYYYTFSMSAQILTPILSGWFLENAGYHTLFPYAAVFMGLAFCTMLMVRHGDSKPVAPKDKMEMLDIGE